MASSFDAGVLGDMWSSFWRSLSESGQVNWTALVSLCVGMAAAVLVLVVANATCKHFVLLHCRSCICCLSEVVLEKEGLMLNGQPRSDAAKRGRSSMKGRSPARSPARSPSPPRR